MMTKNIIFILFLLTLLVSKSSFALGKLGHQIVCQLAFEHLSPAKKTHVTALLATIPEQHQSLLNRYNYKKQGLPISFADACTWADAVKRLESFKSYSSWHYMNVTREHNSIQANDCNKNCLPQAILHHQQILAKNKKQQNWQQAQALFFLGHWLGDIHQPLHVSFADNLGGNKVKLSHLTSKCNNLHWYWDECILSRGKHSKVKWLTLLTEKWDQQSQPNWQAKHVWQWADESFQLVKEPSFNYCQPTEQGYCQNIEGEIKLPVDYLSQYQKVMEQRLLQAAQRLTKMLESIL